VLHNNVVKDYADLNVTEYFVQGVCKLTLELHIKERKCQSIATVYIYILYIYIYIFGFTWLQFRLAMSHLQVIELIALTKQLL
jgi:hypothetical protein